MKTFKKIILVLAALCMLLGCAPFGFAEDIGTGSIITFGQYPSLSVTDEYQIETLNSRDLYWKYFDMFSQYGYMVYADVSNVFETGDRYRAIMFTHERSANGYKSNLIHWFKYQPIEWRVLDADSGLIMAENIIDSQPFHFGQKGAKDQNGNTHDTSEWEYSTLRSWLNYDFYNTAFGQEKDYIFDTELKTPIDKQKTVFAITTDRVFLLSDDDVFNPEYGFTDDAARVAYGTDYAISQGLSDGHPWSLRTYGGHSWTYNVGGGGGVGAWGIYYAFSDWIGVRPAMRADLKSAVGKSLIRLTEKSEIKIKGPAGTEYDKAIIIAGDVNSDKKVLADDARLALRASARLESLTEDQRKAADVNGDGEVLADDARLILRYSAKLEKEFPVQAA